MTGMTTRTRRNLPPPRADAPAATDMFASDFDVHDWEDWCRLICWVDTVEPNGDGDLQVGRRFVATVVIPRSSLGRLIRVLRHSVAQQKEPGRH